ncbi:LysR family transcriptional regulator [Pantoea sp. S61]|uniref:LysR family transcriptional regulator n=1 Tax=Pantoea sp. S61 TaxID=2767442 RepID=UPI00190BD224|nr:LysR family transcriptional regulator [Pantoea sp. S61]MBK0122234.1 LysR family transcriptional regulator [Pantoea sp. S61]MBK0123057.1 LysR family transcriptional regulator [Pantoea sp. S61]
MKSKSLAQVTDFDLKLLRLFKTVNESGSFSAAESLLGMTRSAISLHMGDLEKRLGMRLCQRGRAGFALTEEGREILRHSDSMMAAIEQFRLQVNQMHKQLRGDLNIGIINNLVTQPRMKITHALEKLHEIGPDIRLNISMMTAAEIERGLMDGRLHVGALPVTSPISGLDYMPLYDERSQLYCSDTHALFSHEPDDAQLKGCDAIAPAFRMTAEAIAMHQKLNCNATATDREGIAFLILTGRFIGFLPDHYAAQWVEKKIMRAIAPERFHFTSKIAVVTRKGRSQNAILERFMQAIEWE